MNFALSLFIVAATTEILAVGALVYHDLRTKRLLRRYQKIQLYMLKILQMQESFRLRAKRAQQEELRRTSWAGQIQRRDCEPLAVTRARDRHRRGEPEPGTFLAAHKDFQEAVLEFWAELQKPFIPVVAWLVKFLRSLAFLDFD